MQNGTDPRERKDPKQPKQEKVRVRFRPARFFLTFLLLAAVVAGAFLLLHKIDAQKGGEEAARRLRNGLSALGRRDDSRV